MESEQPNAQQQQVGQSQPVQQQQQQPGAPSQGPPPPPPQQAGAGQVQQGQQGTQPPAPSSSSAPTPAPQPPLPTPLPPPSSFLPPRTLSDALPSPPKQPLPSFTPRPADTLPPLHTALSSTSPHPPSESSPAPPPMAPVMGPPLPPSSTPAPAGPPPPPGPQQQSMPPVGPLPPPVWSHVPGLGPPPIPPPVQSATHQPLPPAPSSDMRGERGERSERGDRGDRMQVDHPPPAQSNAPPQQTTQLPGIASFGQPLTPQPLAPLQHHSHNNHLPHLPPASHFVQQAMPPPHPILGPEEQVQQMQIDGDNDGQGGRSLNVKDALTYLDQVKNEFTDRADVYNLFLDIMKDFKAQTIDTPRVIDRVSQLFAGHNQLIQGFNTFLPPGYRIETMVDPMDPDRILVTTPAGTISTSISHNGRLTGTGNGGYGPPGPQQSLLAPSGGNYQGMPPHQSTPGGASQGGHYGLPQSGIFPSPQPLLPHQTPVHHSHAAPLGHHAPAHFVPSAPHTPVPLLPGGGGNQYPAATPDVPINHAIHFVNEIKVRFSHEPDKYKAFLDILQTYQQRARPIAEVFQQVNDLFDGQEDLIAEFQEFLPDKGRYGFEALAGEGASQLASINGPGGMAMQIDGPTGMRGGQDNLSAVAGARERESRRERDDRERREKARDKEQVKRKKRSAPEPVIVQGSSRGGPRGGQQQPTTKKAKTSHAKPESPPPQPPTADPRSHHHRNHAQQPSAPPPALAPAPPAVAAPAPVQPAKQNPVAYFDRLKKHINNNAVYAELLKLLNLYTQRMFDMRVLVQRARPFFHEPGSLQYWRDFLEVLEVSERDAEGFLSGRAGAGPDAEIIGRDGEKLIHPLERPRLNIETLKRYGPSYRKLPKNEINLECSGRDALCWQVLNDQWISHPTWASEEAGFSTHKKNAFEEAMHRSEEERHEFDFHIEANIRTISMLEPINQRILTMDSEEKSKLRLPPGLGGQSKGVYARIIKKVYPDTHAEVMQALQESPAIAVPVVLARLKAKDEEWRKAQREWNKVWREVEARNFYKSLDHMSASFRQEDKKKFTSKRVTDEIDDIKAEQDAMAIRDAHAQSRPPSANARGAAGKYQIESSMDDPDVLVDLCKLVFSFMDRGPGNLSYSERNKAERLLRTWLPKIHGLDPDTLFKDLPPLPEESEDEDEADAEDGTPAMLAPPPTTRANGHVRRSHHATAAGSKKKKGGRAAARAQQQAREGTVMSEQLDVGGTATPEPGQSVDGDVEMAVAAPPAAPESGPSTLTVPQPTAGPGATTPPPDQANPLADATKPWIDIVHREDGDDAMHAPLSSGEQPAEFSSIRDDPLPPRLSPSIRPVEMNGVLHDDVNMDVEMDQKPVLNGVSASDDGEMPSVRLPGEKKRPYVKRVFYANQTFCVLYRFIEIMYGRLHGLKYYDTPIWNDKPNPLAVELGLLEDKEGDPNLASNRSVVSASELYKHLLSQVESFLGGNIDETQLVDSARNLFGTAAYVVVTLQWNLALIARFAKQAAEEESCREMSALFASDEPRQAAIKEVLVPGSEAMRADLRAQIIYRREAEKRIPDKEKGVMYRLEWEGGVGTRDAMHLAILRKDDLSGEEPDGVREKWRVYIDSYSINSPTENLPKGQAHAAFLRRLIPPNTDEIKQMPGFAANSKLKIRVCVRTYKLFFVAGSEEWMVVRKGAADSQKLERRRDERRSKGLEKMKGWVDGRLRRAVRA